MDKLTITRANFSIYFNESFQTKEEKELLKYGDYSSNFEALPNILITNTETDLEDLERKGLLKKIKLIIHPNSGHDNLSRKIIEKIKVPVILGNSIRKEAVVNYILHCILESAGNIPWRQKWESGRNWERRKLENLDTLIIGYGHVGKSLQKKIKPLVKKTFIHDPDLGFENINEASNADIIVICASLTNSSEDLVNKKFLKNLKKNVTIINPARGKIICLDDLVEFLNKNKSSKAFVDVYPNEPYEIESIKTINNLFTSCHVAGVYQSIDDDIIRFESKVIQDFINLNFSQFEIAYREINLTSKISTGV